MNCQILVIDFGSQVTKLIARRIRECGVYCEIKPFNKVTINFLKNSNFKGFIFSGSPSSVEDKKFPNVTNFIFETNLPILGICYGAQLLTKIFDGKVKNSAEREFGNARLNVQKKSLLLKNINFNEGNNQVWMSHSDKIIKLPKDFEHIAFTENSEYAVIQNLKKKYFGVQFHPEVSHTKNGKKIFFNFIYDICLCKKDWGIKSQKLQIIETIKNQVGNERVICGLSGGVDSTVTSFIIHQAIGKNLTCIYIDTGLMRKNETFEIEKIFKKNFSINIIIVDASKLFLKKLNGVIEPEQKRKIIGETFIRIFEENSKKLSKIKFLAQGTLYPDIIESVATVGKKKVTIKSHHNVGGLPKKMKFQLVEPLKNLFKDEVRKLGKELMIPDFFIKRHPFPGPGLGIRIIGQITEQRIKILQEADEIFLKELEAAKLYDKIWQAFCVLLPVKSVGVMGDNRTYEQVCVLRAITSIDGMTAKPYLFNTKFLSRCADKIVNKVKGINRVCYDYTSKPPGTIEFE